MKKRTFKYRFYPSREQEDLLAKTFGCVRVVYNQILRYRADAFYRNGDSVSYADASKKLTEIKKNIDFVWLNDVSSVPLQQCLRHEQTAFKNFFSGRTRYPVFKKKRGK